MSLEEATGSCRRTPAGDHRTSAGFPQKILRPSIAEHLRDARISASREAGIFSCNGLIHHGFLIGIRGRSLLRGIRPRHRQPKGGKPPHESRL